MKAILASKFLAIPSTSLPAVRSTDENFSEASEAWRLVRLAADCECLDDYGHTGTLLATSSEWIGNKVVLPDSRYPSIDAEELEF